MVAPWRELIQWIGRRTLAMRGAWGLSILAVVISGIGLDRLAAEEPKSMTTTWKVATYNIRYANAGDGLNAWPFRRGDVARLLTDHQVDIAGLQEALGGQLRDLDELLPDYGRVGVGREDGKDRGEYSPILYRKDKLRVREFSTRWLSETPEVAGSKSWDAAITRIVTRCVFTPIKADSAGSNEAFVVFNTHFDHQGAEARRESAKLLRRWIEQETLPCLLMGDFNCRATDPPCLELTETRGGRSVLVDSRGVSSKPFEGPDSTWNGFDTIVPGQRIDFVFVRSGWRVVRHVTDDRRREGERFPSDHLPVIVTLAIGKEHDSH